MYRPFCLIEAYGSPKKYWLVPVGLFAMYLFDLNFIFLSTGLPVAAELAADLEDIFCC
jgi:hypothetical protein